MLKFCFLAPPQNYPKPSQPARQDTEVGAGLSWKRPGCPSLALFLPFSLWEVAPPAIRDPWGIGPGAAHVAGGETEAQSREWPYLSHPGNE